jgi:lipid-A-disaccharide synthase
MKKGTKILLLAGEESGLIYANLLREHFAGAEVRTYQDSFSTNDLAVMGFFSVLKRIFFFMRVKRETEKIIREWKPDIVVTIDYPGMNLKLAAYAKARGIPAVHIVCPQVWAWHQNRIPKIAASLTKLLCFFPFEPKLYDGTGLDVKFIGHPLVDTFDAEGKGDVSVEERLVALLPGSRAGEIKRILPKLLETAKILSTDKTLKFTIPAATPKARKQIDEIVKSFSIPSLHIQNGGARDLLRKASVAAVASGTATLEAALAKCPTILVYEVSRFFAWFARRVITGVKYIGLANIIAEKTGLNPPMPEMLQEDFVPVKVADQLRVWLDNPKERIRITDNLKVVTDSLRGDGGAVKRAVDEIEDVLNKGGEK